MKVYLKPKKITTAYYQKVEKTLITKGRILGSKFIWRTQRLIFKKIAFYGFIGIIALVCGLVLHNNYGDTKVSDKDIQLVFNDAVDWIKQHKHQIKHTHNPMLWWMIAEAASISNNTDLKEVFEEYRDKNFDKYKHSPWSYLFFKSNSDISQYEALLFSLPDYNQHFIYGFSCDSDLGMLDIIKRQNETDFCWKNHPISPACITHQMMGYRFMQRTSCKDVKKLSEKIITLSEFIRFQSIFDFRIVDVYIQRVLMLYDSGHSAKVNNRWIKRIIDHQSSDGGWDDFQPLINIQGNRYFGYSSAGFSVAIPKSNFHASAQGIWLMALLLNQ